MSINDYTFNKMNRLGSENIDNTIQNIQNTKFANYMLSSYFSETLTDDTINFVSNQPTMNISCRGLNSHIIDTDSNLTINIGQEKPLDKLNLQPRPFLTIPYLGKGNCDPTLESKLLQGENIYEKKSVSTIMDKNFSSYRTLYPTQSQENTNTVSHKIEESAMENWTRGGSASRLY